MVVQNVPETREMEQISELRTTSKGKKIKLNKQNFLAGRWFGLKHLSLKLDHKFCVLNPHKGEEEKQSHPQRHKVRSHNKQELVFSFY